MLDILLEGLRILEVFICMENFKVLSMLFHVVAALLSELHMLLAVSEDLVCEGPKQAISIGLHLSDMEAQRLHLFHEIIEVLAIVFPGFFAALGTSTSSRTC